MRSKEITLKDFFWLSVLGIGVMIWTALAIIGAYHLYEVWRSVFSRSVV